MGHLQQVGHTTAPHTMEGQQAEWGVDQAADGAVGRRVTAAGLAGRPDAIYVMFRTRRGPRRSDAWLLGWGRPPEGGSAGSFGAWTDSTSRVWWHLTTSTRDCTDKCCPSPQSTCVCARVFPDRKGGCFAGGRQGPGAAGHEGTAGARHLTEARLGDPSGRLALAVNMGRVAG